MQRRTHPRVVLVGDIGGVDTLHVGDEAMFGADLGLVRRLLPQSSCIAVSADPTHTSAIYSVDAVGRADAARAARAADLLVVTGGGNLNSSFPDHLAERLELARATAEAGGVVVLLGQMLGPELHASDADRVSELLSLSAFVGVRDQASLAVARRFGATEDRLFEQLDDAWAVGADVEVRSALDLEDGSYAVVTLHPDARIVARGALDTIADQFEELVRAAGMPVVLLPHCRAPEGVAGTSDEDVGAALAERLAARAVPHFSLPVLSPSLTAALTRRSALVVTTRYHPVVFAASGGVPVLAVWADEYVHWKQRGALAPSGLDGWMLALDDVFERGMSSALDELWHRRTEIVEWLTAWAPDLERRMRARDDALGDQLREAGFEVSVAPAPPGRSKPGAMTGPAPAPTGRWHTFARPAPGSPRRCTVLDRLHLEVHPDHLALTARVHSRDVEASEVRLRVHDPSLADRLDASATPFLPIMLTLAASSGTDLLIDAPVDTTALDRVEAIAKLHRDWWGWRAPEIDAVEMARERERPPGVGLWFSRGVDSTDSLVRSLQGELVEDGESMTVSHLLGLDWIDAPYAAPHAPAIWEDTASTAASVGLPLLRLTTDVRTVLEPFVGWKHSHGAVFAGLGLLAGPLLGTVVISASADSDDPRPLGSHPQLDPLFGTATTRIAHVGRMTRSEKVFRLVESEWDLDALKVCWEVDSRRNCGRCAKCLATMTALRAAGALERCHSFDARLTVDAVRAIARAEQPVAIGPHTTRDAVEVARLVDDDLRDAWREVEERVLRDAAWLPASRVADEPTGG